MEETIETNDNNASNEEPSGAPSQHIRLFDDYEDKMEKVKPMDEEKRLEQEKYEKQIGYLTYLGQDTNEALGKRNWYDVARKTDDAVDETGQQIEIGLKSKNLYDPMRIFVERNSFSKNLKSTATTTGKTNDEPKLSYQPILHSRKRSLTPDDRHSDRKRRKHNSSSTSPKKSKSKSKDKKHKSKKSKKHKKNKRRHGSDDDGSDSERKKCKSDMMKRLRQQRLQREKEEQLRTDGYLREKFPSLLPPEEKKADKEELVSRGPVMKRKYNSQFNPFLAKQNYA